MAFQPGLPGSQFPGEDYIVRELKELRRMYQELAAANPFAPMGIHPLPGATQFDGNVTSNGQLTANGLTVNGAAVIAGTLSLPAGIINNDALVAPIVPVAYHADVQNISITSGANVEKLHIDVPVPAGYSQALVNLTATMNMLNNSGSTDSAYLGANINGVSPGWAANGTAANGAEVSLSNTVVALVTGLSGGTFPLSGKASSNTNTWTASGTSAVMNLNATILFLR